MKEKTVAQSRTEMSQLMLPQHANIAGTVYGGVILSTIEQIMEFIPDACLSSHLKFFNKILLCPCQNVAFAKALALLYFKLSNIQGSVKAVRFVKLIIQN